MKEEIRESLSGVFAPMVTPFNNDNIDIDGLRNNVEKMNKSGLKGYFVLGTNGEYKTLEVEEQIKVLNAVVGHRSSDKIVMAGCGAESTRTTINAVKLAVDCGADMVSLLMPYFFAKRITNEVMISHIISVADASEVPVLLYNNPSVSAGVKIGPEVIRKVKEHPMVVGIKDSSNDSWKPNLEAAGDDLLVLAGSANYFLELLIAGGCGGVLSLANVFPERCASLYEAFINGKQSEAKLISDEIVSLNHEVSGSYGIAGVKAAMDIVGLSGGAPRKPIPSLSDSEIADLKEKFRSRRLLNDLG